MITDDELDDDLSDDDDRTRTEAAMALRLELTSAISKSTSNCKIATFSCE
jgi:hypothetical protein